MSRYSTLNKVFAGFSFLGALLTYLLTLQPTVPFWDCGEFAAAAMWQQVPHPPGAPLWLIVGKVFELIMPGDPGWAFNLFAATCSALAVMFTYLIVVNAVERWRPKREGQPISAYLSTFGAGLIAAFAFTFSDTHWFNSVESEVYSAATLLTAFLMWLMMKWDQNAGKPGHERWALLMAYVCGLAIGVHLLALLVIPAIAMVIYFRQYNFEWKTFLITVGITGVAFYVMYNATLSWIPELLAANTVIGLLILAGLVAGAVWARKNNRPVLHLATSAFLLVILGYTSYSQILVRAQAHPPMNENEPDTFEELAAYLGREQYGDRPHWPRRVDYHSYHAQTMAAYGPPTPPEYVAGPDGRQEPVFDQINTGVELKYMWDYQIMKMYFRYLGWNYIGRASDVQDAPAVLFDVDKTTQQRYIQPTGYSDVFPVQFFALPFLLGLFGIYFHFKRDKKMATVFMALFLLLGVLTALQQRQQDPQPRERDYFYAASFMVYAMWIGIGGMGLAEAFGGAKDRKEIEDGEIADPPMPGNVGVKGAILAAAFLAAPVNMAIGGWELHDRSGNYLAWDYAYNLLQSVEEDAVLFTNGDNDTFPLWYLQDVAAVRRDVRVVNLELAQTRWYLYQMQYERPWGAKLVPVNFPASVFEVPEGSPGSLTFQQSSGPEVVRIPYSGEAAARASRNEVTEGGEFVWEQPGQDYGQGRRVFTVKDQIIRNILQTNKFERPIYFSVTAGPDVMAGLDGYLLQRGLAYQVMPFPQEGRIGGTYAYDRAVMDSCFMATMEHEEHYLDQRYGFKFRGLNDPGAYFMGQDDHRRPQNIFYRPQMLQYAAWLINQGDNEHGVRVLDRMDELMPLGRFGPPYIFGSDYSFAIYTADLYEQAGATDRAKVFAERALALLAEALEENLMPEQPRYITDVAEYVRAKAYTIQDRYPEAIAEYEIVQQMAPGDRQIQYDINTLQILEQLEAGDTAGAREIYGEVMAGYGVRNEGEPLDPYAGRLRARFGPLLGELQAELDNTAVDEGVLERTDTD